MLSKIPEMADKINCGRDLAWWSPITPQIQVDIDLDLKSSVDDTDNNSALMLSITKGKKAGNPG